MLLHNLREKKQFIKELDFIAIIDNKIVGNIIYAETKIIDTNRQEHKVVTFGHVSVLPEYQKKGIGSKLIKHTVAQEKFLKIANKFI